jgi:hypothetical protein
VIAIAAPVFAAAVPVIDPVQQVHCVVVRCAAADLLKDGVLLDVTASSMHAVVLSLFQKLCDALHGRITVSILCAI